MVASRKEAGKRLIVKGAFIGREQRVSHESSLVERQGRGTARNGRDLGSAFGGAAETGEPDGS
jgi:hypothetical protein